MELTFLGTGTSQGVPVIACKCHVCKSNDVQDNRLRTSAMISYNDKNIVIDTGPDFRQQMLREKVEHLDAVLFTHEHKDHIAGLDDVRAFNYIQKQPTDIYASASVIQALEREFYYAFEEVKYPGVPQLQVHEIFNQPFKLFGRQIIPIKVWHYKLPVFGYRIGDITYITDANRIDEEEKEKIKGTKVLIVNALRKEKHISHFTLDEAVELSQKVGAESAYLTHISHLMGDHHSVNRGLPQNIQLAYDGLSIDF
ncbi:MAG TPA: MBL fold metallo-hydrolase [Flavobacteriales bacterium]|nr:MBL fold metallo-hydrolase [Flavobacteriales bacterium]